MKKLLLLVSVTFIVSLAMSQNCATTIVAGYEVIKTDSQLVENGEALWICEDLTVEIGGANNVVYVEKGGDITVTGDNQLNIWVKYPGTLTINSDNNALFHVDSGVVVNNNGSGNSVTICSNALQPVVFNYDNITGVTDCIDTSTTVGISSVNLQNNIKLYPNPVINVLNVDIPLDAGVSTYNIYSMSGKVVLTGVLVEGTNQIDLSSSVKGLYLIEIQNSLGKVSKRISVE